MTQQLNLGEHEFPQPSATITIGISASGKTTWAELEATKTSSKVICRDDIRRSLFNFSKWSDYRFTRAKEEKVSAVVKELLIECSITEQSVILSDTNLNSRYRDTLVDLLCNLGFEVVTKEFPISYEEAVTRDLGRLHSVGSQVIYKQYQQWLKYKGRWVYKADKTLPTAIIVDVDGTIARKSPERGYFDWKKVGLDSVREQIAGIVRGLGDDYHIVILSGRDAICRQESCDWLRKNLIFYDEIYMREEKDNRKDTIIKEELFWSHVAPYYNVVSVIDDRPCMIRLWYELGIENVISVGNPCEEF